MKNPNNWWAAGVIWPLITFAFDDKYLPYCMGVWVIILLVAGYLTGQRTDYDRFEDPTELNTKDSE